jgi:hypothetical protein
MVTKVLEQVQHPGQTSIKQFIFALAVAIGPWMAAMASWSEAIQIGNVGVLLGIIGGCGLAYYAKSPKKGN